MKCPGCGGEMTREPMTDFARDVVATVNVCDPCPALGFGRYTALDDHDDSAGRTPKSTRSSPSSPPS